MRNDYHSVFVRVKNFHSFSNRFRKPRPRLSLKSKLLLGVLWHCLSHKSNMSRFRHSLDSFAP